MPMISIIMPVYNKEKYIRKSITSILGQDYKDFELIIIDDGSTDHSLSIIQEYEKQDERIKVISTENGGVSKARNIGLDHARSDYILFFDADDYVNQTGLDTVCKNIEKYKPDILFSSIYKVNQNGEIISNLNFPYQGYYECFKDQYKEFIKLQLETGLYGCVSNKIIKRDIVEENDIRFNENITLAEDFDFFLSLYPFIKNCYYCADGYLYYLQNADNSSTSIQSKKTPEYFKQLEILMKEYRMLEKYDDSVLLRIRINDYILYYLKENYLDDTHSYPIEKLIDLDINNHIMLNDRKMLDKSLLNCLLKGRMNILKIVLAFYKNARKMKNIFWR